MSGNKIFTIGLAGFLLGVSAVSFLVFPAEIYWLLLLSGFLILIIRHPIAVVVGVVLISVGAGMWRTEIRIDRPSALWKIAALEQKVTVRGYVDGDFKRTQHGGRYAFHVLQIGDRAVNERIMVYGPEWIRPRYGQLLSLFGTLRQPTNSEDGFDYVSWLAKNGISAQMSYPEYGVPTDLRISWGQQVTRTIGISVRIVRYAARDAVLAAVPQPAAGYIIGILVGDEADIDPGLQNMFSRTGTSHILVVSGYNITIVAAACMAVLAPLGRRKAYWFAFAGVCAFTLLVGAAPSVVRAALMGLLALTARQLGRSQQAGTAILLSAALMCAVNPLVLRWDAGFQLSFLAVLGLIYLEPIVRPMWDRIFRWQVLAETAATTTGAQLAVLPLLLFQFGMLAPYALPVNMIILPIVPLAMLLGGITVAAGMLWPFLGALIGQLTWLVAALQLAIIRFADTLPHASLAVSLSPSLFCVAYIGLAAFVFSVYRKRGTTMKIQIND